MKVYKSFTIGFTQNNATNPISIRPVRIETPDQIDRKQVEHSLKVLSDFIERERNPLEWSEELISDLMDSACGTSWRWAFMDESEIIGIFDLHFEF